MIDAMREDATDRRDFLRTGARFIALGVLVGGGTWITLRRPRATCTRRLPCDACTLFADCQLPPADAARSLKSDSEGAHV